MASPRNTRRSSSTRAGSGGPASTALLLERALSAMRRVWRGGPELHADIALAVTSLKQLTPQVSSTNEIATVFGSTIDTLLHLPRDERARREVVTRLGQQLQAIRPHIGAGDAPAEVGKLNTALGEKRAGRPPKPRAPRVTTVRPLPPDALITELPHVGASFAKRYEEGLNLHSIEDVLRMVPRRHIDYSNTIRLDDPIGLRGEVTVRGKLVEVREIRGAGTPRVQARVFDGAGSLRITWFSTFIAKQLAEGDEIVVSGLIQPGYGGLQMTNPEWERVGGAGLSTGRLIPVYSLTKGVAQKSLRTLTRNALDATKKHLVDWLADAREYIPENAWNALPALEEMYENLHYPASMEDFKRARARLMFENLFLLQLGLVEQKKRRKQEQGRAFEIDLTTVRAFYETLPFTLTGAQSRAISEILSDVRQDQPMTRLLQGDVGSGKTVVAATIALAAKENGLQAAIMAPTELLAEQHATNLEALYAQLSEESRPRLALLTGSTRAAPRRTMLAALDAGEIDVLIGTHALIQDDVLFQNLGLVVIDEQHRFGVRQRGLLTAKAHGFQPHLLSMTATPIPRTLNLVLNGDLDVSIIDERPPGRIPIETRRYLGQNRVEAYHIVREQVARGHQVFVICPLVEGSDTIEAKAAVDEAQRLQEEVFPDLRVDVLHGKMSSKNKDDVMTRFRDRQFDILVSTSVIEVGIDIPNATVMMIEGADRFGLAQLHQFRGRVGRGGSKSFCLLLADDVSGDSDARLHSMVASDDGFVLAERDLELRGPGDFLGTRQSGLPELGWLEQGFDTRLLDLARESAERLIAVSPHVDVNRFQRLKPRLQRFWATRQEPENNLH